MLQRVFSLFSTLSIYISESETKGWSLWEFSAKSVCDGRGRSWGKVPMGRPELRLPQQKFCQDWIFVRRVEKSHLPGYGSRDLLLRVVFFPTYI